MTNEGHTYIIEKIDADEYTIDKAGYKRNVTITLRDLTIGKTIKRRGTSKMIGNFSPIWINALEGHKKVYVAMSDKDTPCKLERSPSERENDYWLNHV